MTATQDSDVPYLDLTDPAFSITSEAVHEAREQSWYARTTYGLAVLRYDEVSRLIKNPNLRQGSVQWPSHNGITTGPWAKWFDSWVLNKEGEEHHRLRRLMNPAFSRKLIDGLVPRFQALAGELIDGFNHPDHCEFVTEFAEPYAARVIAIMLGIPEEEWPIIARESTTLGLGMGVTVSEDLPKIESALTNLYEYSDDLIAKRKKSPSGDFVTRLVEAHRQDDTMSSDELRDAMVLLIFGGFDTTRNQLGLAMQTFMRYPDQWNLLAERPDLGNKAVEEVMRVNPTVRWVTRQAIKDFEWENVQIDEGTTVHLFTESAGTDPRAFDGPAFDLTAERKPHYGFGGGAHHCLGHFVARSDMSEALPLLARRLRHPHVDGHEAWLADSGNTGPIRLPLSFTPGS